MFVIVFLVVHVIQGYSYGGSRHRKGVSQSQHKIHKGSLSVRHQAHKPRGFRKSSRNVDKKSSFKNHNKRHRRSVDAIISNVDLSVQDFGVFANSHIEIIGNDLELLEQDLVQIFNDIADAQLEKTSVLVNQIGSVFSNNELSEQERSEVLDNEDETNQDRDSQSRKKKILIGKRVVTVKTIAANLMAKVKAIIKKLIKKKKSSTDSINNIVDKKRQGVQEFGDSAQSVIQSIGDDLQELKQDLVQLSTDITDAKLDFADDIIPEVSDDGSKEEPDNEMFEDALMS